MRKILSAWGMIFLMLALVVGTAAAQSGVEGTATPTATSTAVPTSQPAGSTGYLHPIVQILSAYFGRTTRPMMPTPTATATATTDPNATATATTDPNATPTATPTAEPVLGPEDFAKQIAMYHEEGMGFGVLVKLYAMAEASVETCLKQQAAAQTVDPTQAPCEAVTVDELVSEFQSGAGMGQLFKEHGKPALLGVGQVRKALQKEEANLEPTATPVPGTMVGVDPLPQNQTVNKNNGNGNGNSNGKGHTNGNSNKSSKSKAPNPNKPQK